MQDQVVAALNEHFSSDQVRSRRGPGGKQLSYLETHAVIARLNEALGADWSFEVTEYRILDREVVVLGKLSVLADPQIFKTAFGSAQIKRYENNGEPLSLGDDLKAAASDALKKSATLLGVGLHLYDRGNGNGNGRPRGNGNWHRDHWGGNGNGNSGNGRSNGRGMRDPDAPATLAQIRAIFGIGKKRGYVNGDVNQLVSERFDKPSVDDLTKAEASQLIDELQAQ